jgi:hypothetical protein
MNNQGIMLSAVSTVANAKVWYFGRRTLLCLQPLFRLHNNVVAAMTGDTMSLTTVLRVCVVAYVIAIVAELVLTRHYKRFLLELLVVVLVVCLALFVTNTSTGRVAFGEGLTPFWVVAIMFAAAMCGIVARYLFYPHPGQFTWLDFLKPLAITPIGPPGASDLKFTVSSNHLLIKGFVRRQERR